MSHDQSEVEEFMISMNARRQKLTRAAHGLFAESGCSSYVKTIYIGYDFDGVMVGAIYPREDHLEIALALAEDNPSSLLIDASHLTWRTLPVAAVFSDESQLAELASLIDSAVKRITNSEHRVFRDNEYFAKRGRLGND